MGKDIHKYASMSTKNTLNLIVFNIHKYISNLIHEYKMVRFASRKRNLCKLHAKNTGDGSLTLFSAQHSEVSNHTLKRELSVSCYFLNISNNLVQLVNGICTLFWDRGNVFREKSGANQGKMRAITTSSWIHCSYFTAPHSIFSISEESAMER